MGDAATLPGTNPQNGAVTMLFGNRSDLEGVQDKLIPSTIWNPLRNRCVFFFFFMYHHCGIFRAPKAELHRHARMPPLLLERFFFVYLVHRDQCFISFLAK